MKNLEIYMRKFWIVMLASVFLVLNYSQGDVLGFKTFVRSDENILKTTLSLSSQYMVKLEGSSAMVRISQNYFDGKIVFYEGKPTVQQGNLSINVESKEVYVAIFTVGLPHGIGFALAFIVYRSVKYVTEKKKC